MTKRVPDAFVELPTSGVLNPDERTNEKAHHSVGPLSFVARPERFELPTFWFVARRSIQLSYGRIVRTAAERLAKSL